MSAPTRRGPTGWTACSARRATPCGSGAAWVGRETLSQAVERARDGVDRVVVVFSRSYFDAGNTAPTDWEAAFDPPASDPSWLVAVQIDAAPRPVLVRGVKVLTLEGSGPDQAERLREGVMDPAGTAPRDPAGGAR